MPISIVTGASTGVGRALASLLANRGHVVIAAARRGDLLRTLADETSDVKGSIIPCEVDAHS